MPATDVKGIAARGLPNGYMHVGPNGTNMNISWLLVQT
jgi:hypothetical protein